MRRLVVQVAALLAAFASAACTPAAPPSATSAKAAPVLTVADRSEPHTLNPLLIYGLSEDLQVLLFSCLLRSGPRGLIPDIAARIPTLQNGDIARNGRSVTYHLRRGLTWQDGAPLTAGDIVYTYRQIMNPKNDTGARIPYIDVSSAETPDDRTIVVRLKHVDAAFVPKFFAGSFCWGILPEHLLKDDSSINDVPFNGMPIGSGPFKVVSWRRGDRLTLDPNERYTRGAPHLRIIDRFIADSASTLTGLRTGEIDADFHADLEEARSLAGDARYRVIRTPQAAAGTLIYNVTDPIVRDAAFRRSLGYAIDSARIAKQLSDGLFSAADPDRAEFAWGYDATLARPHYEPIKAARMLDALGWHAGADGVRRRGETSLTLSLVTSSDGLDASVAVQLQYALHRLGIEATIKTFDPTTLYALDGPLRTGRFQLAYLPQYYIDFDDASRPAASTSAATATPLSTGKIRRRSRPSIQPREPLPMQLCSSSSWPIRLGFRSGGSAKLKSFPRA
jgi:peptide/nickel transport system substrate-binding protein